MPILIVGLSVVMLAILGKSLVGFPLVAPLVLALSFQTEMRKSLLLAFISGMVVSLVESSALGRESLALLGACGLVHVYGRRFSTRHWFFFGVFAVLGSLLYLFISGKRIGIWDVSVQALLIVLFLFIRRVISERFFSDTIRVNV